LYVIGTLIVFVAIFSVWLVATFPAREGGRVCVRARVYMRVRGVGVVALWYAQILRFVRKFFAFGQFFALLGSFLRMRKFFAFRQFFSLSGSFLRTKRNICAPHDCAVKRRHNASRFQLRHRRPDRAT
jgi:uncharacterized membrane protein YgcG